MKIRPPSRAAACFAFTLLAIVSSSCSGGGGDGEEAVTFPRSFLFGTASASYQVEGWHDVGRGIARSNWYEWEQMGRIAEGHANPDGSGFYEQYASDFATARRLGNRAYRLSLSWERIEPEEGRFDEEALRHYVEVIDAARAEGLEPMVTLYHWVVPAWLESPLAETVGVGERSHRFTEAFEAFARWVVPRIADRVDLYCLVNEPIVPAGEGYMTGNHPPGHVFDLVGYSASLGNLAFAHAAGVRAIRALDSVDADGDGRASMCGSAMASSYAIPRDPEDPTDVAAAQAINYVSTYAWLDALVTGDLDLDYDHASRSRWTWPPEGHYEDLAGTMDYVGVNFYGPSWAVGGSFTWVPIIHGLPVFWPAGMPEGLVRTEMGSAIWPEGLRGSVRAISERYGLPIYVTENGVADEDDSQRPRYLVEHLWVLGEEIERGIDIRGYFHWSLTDNFEWHRGRTQHFGLYGVDYDDAGMPRITRSSAELYGEIATARRITRSLYDEMRAQPYPPE